MIALFGKPEKRVPKKQKESALQRDIIKALNTWGVGYFFRIRNGATFDPKVKQFRSNTAEKGIPDILGWKKPGRMVLIEVKYLQFVENKKKLTFVVRLSDEQKVLLKKAHDDGALAGVAFTLEDAINIVHDDPFRFPRHPRTYGFMDKEWLDIYAEDYRERKKILSEYMSDPVRAALDY